MLRGTTLRVLGVGALCLGGLVAAPRTASAFCGFYVSGGDAKLYNNATVVVLMRDGTRTVLSMQNNYQGPPMAFAMVVPVPVVLQKADVRTLPREIFDRVDQLGAPRLVEYWESDPCNPEVEAFGVGGLGLVGTGRGGGGTGEGTNGVKIEAQFKVGEYEVVVLSAKDSSGLYTWLRGHKYNIPEGAEEALRPYVVSGMKFFVAKVDPKKVQFDAEGRTMLSPLRFHYDSEQFNLPVRLGLINSAGDQDLLVNILAARRHEVANYPNVFAPTNVDVKDAVRSRFGEFYVALFDAVLKQTPNAVVTEYAWQANNCDPCPGEPLTMAELVTLGADVLPRYQQKVAAGDRGLAWSMPEEFVLTRLHARYTRDSLGEDLVFRAADAVVGGREDNSPGGGILAAAHHPDEVIAMRQSQKAMPGPINNFQARYIIRHPWTGKTDCPNPEFGHWGGPPGGQASEQPKPALGLAFASRGGDISMDVARDVPAAGIVAADPVKLNEANNAPIRRKPKPDPPAATEAEAGRTGCLCRSEPAPPPATGLLALAWLFVRRRRPSGRS
jgi:MYXO-CTERM domain-containing protein